MVEHAGRPGAVVADDHAAAVDVVEAGDRRRDAGRAADQQRRRRARPPGRAPAAVLTSNAPPRRRSSSVGAGNGGFCRISGMPARVNSGRPPCCHRVKRGPQLGVERGRRPDPVGLGAFRCRDRGHRGLLPPAAGVPGADDGGTRAGPADDSRCAAARQHLGGKPSGVAGPPGSAASRPGAPWAAPVASSDRRYSGRDQVWLIMCWPNASSGCSLSRVKPAAW